MARRCRSCGVLLRRHRVTANLPSGWAHRAKTPKSWHVPEPMSEREQAQYEAAQEDTSRKTEDA